MMVARARHARDTLAVVFERDGEPPVRIETTGDRALLRAVAILLAYRKLQVGDRLTVTSSE